jgi:hypothetical protein
MAAETGLEAVLALSCCLEVLGTACLGALDDGARMPTPTTANPLRNPGVSSSLGAFGSPGGRGTQQFSQQQQSDFLSQALSCVGVVELLASCCKLCLPDGCWDEGADNSGYEVIECMGLLGCLEWRKEWVLTGRCGSIQNHSKRFLSHRSIPQRMSAKLQARFSINAVVDTRGGISVHPNGSDEGTAGKLPGRCPPDLLLAVRLQALSCLSAFASYWRTGVRRGHATFPFIGSTLNVSFTHPYAQPLPGVNQHLTLCLRCPS